MGRALHARAPADPGAIREGAPAGRPALRRLQAQPLIEPYLDHPDPDVRAEAHLAAAEITATQQGPIHNS